ncbi:FAD/NAD(P)-binding protein [Pseudoclavibacter terrae]|uniref:FAD/NAD(P)-binding protein n=1 Tax=Pseudoclavibacter terrae TaxID=1530195 RepID=UPI001AD7776E|nr:FAD/NAD(P)-binding protein [Pseudoclavibacter terrae]
MTSAARLVDSDSSKGARCIAVLGAGPRGAGLLERIVANYDADDTGQLVVHLIDPHPPGAGRIWRDAQSGLLKLNSLAADVTMFTDKTSTIEGPVREGPSLVEWAQLATRGALPGYDLDTEAPQLAAEIRALGPASFPTRRLQSRYLGWFFEQAADAAPEGLTVLVHTAQVTGVTTLENGSQRVELDTGDGLTVDVVVYALGHSGTRVHEGTRTAELSDFAARHELAYVPPSFTADADFSAVRAGEPVIVRGLGLAAVDLLVLLTEGRGGAFVRSPDEGRLTYLPSGREPRILVGSRRGVPYHSKVTSVLQGEPFETRYFTPDIAREVVARHDILDFRAHFWPLLAKEMLHGYYRELFTGHPERVRISWVEFRAELDRFGAQSPELHDAVIAALVDPSDELDIATFDHPLRGATATDVGSVSASLHAYIREDLRRRNRQEHSESQGLFLALLFSYMTFVEFQDAPNWSPASLAGDVRVWWKGFFSYVASGPPGHRLDELLALSEAGVVHFLGGDLRVWEDEETGSFRARGSTLEREVSARALIDAWLPDSDVAHTDNDALRQLLASGEGRERVAVTPEGSLATGVIEVRRADSRIVRADGTAHPRRFAVGPYTSNPFVGAFSRPRTNAVSFRENDAVALSTLRLVGDISRENQDREQHDHAAEHHHRRPVRQALGGLARQS